MLSLLLHWVHLLSVVVWIGGVAYTVLVMLPNMQLIALRDRARLVPRILSRFLKIVWTSIALIAVSGLYRVVVVLNITGIEPLLLSRYGNILTLKLLLVAALIAVAASLTVRIYPRIVSHVATHINDGPDAYKCPACGSIVGTIRLHLKTGLALAAVIIFLAATLRGA
ncbi:MAG: CopD family protein [Aigarchaeota archaeon]|nr:CopD family protein [Candidatus Pelearchaeum maunauluense]